ncbi:MAG TPA: hypothetical protein VGE12_01455 [Noviherbaspirillum sp.]
MNPSKFPPPWVATEDQNIVGTRTLILSVYRLHRHPVIHVLAMHRPYSHGYHPDQLLDALLHRLGLRGDGALASRLKIDKRLLREIRYGRQPIPASLLLLMQESTGISIAELRRAMGDRRARIRLCYPIRKREAPPECRSVKPHAQ